MASIDVTHWPGPKGRREASVQTSGWGWGEPGNRTHPSPGQAVSRGCRPVPAFAGGGDTRWACNPARTGRPCLATANTAGSPLKIPVPLPAATAATCNQSRCPHPAPLPAPALAGSGVRRAPPFQRLCSAPHLFPAEYSGMRSRHQRNGPPVLPVALTAPHRAAGWGPAGTLRVAPVSFPRLRQNIQRPQTGCGPRGQRPPHTQNLRAPARSQALRDHVPAREV